MNFTTDLLQMQCRARSHNGIHILVSKANSSQRAEAKKPTWWERAIKAKILQFLYGDWSSTH